MASREDIAETIKERFQAVKERGKVVAQAIRARAGIAAVRRRLRSAYADLGEEVYQKMAAGQGGPWTTDPDLVDCQRRIEGIQAEMRQRERNLEEIMAQRDAKGVGRSTEAEEADSDGARRGRGKGPSPGEAGTDTGPVR